MPRYEDYAGLTPVEALRQFAEHHSEPRTRHITSESASSCMTQRIGWSKEAVGASSRPSCVTIPPALGAPVTGAADAEGARAVLRAARPIPLFAPD